MYKIVPIKKINKTLFVAADKSISHRALILSSLTKSKTLISNILDSDDIKATIDCLRRLGVRIVLKPKSIAVVYGVGKYFLKKQLVRLYARESGTTIRLLTGILCAQKFPVKFEAGPTLNLRPMARIVYPLREMSAVFKNKERKLKTNSEKNIYPPLEIEPAKAITAGKFKMAIASAQVKSALIFAALYAQEQSVIIEPYKSRDHTERMLSLFKAGIKVKSSRIAINPLKKLVSPGKIFVPADFSSAAFFMVLGLIAKDSKICLKDVNLNPTRSGLLKVLRRMGARIKIANKKNGFEPYGDIFVESSKLISANVLADEIPLMIDEIPILCVAASFAKGVTRIFGLRELKVKETDRINSMVKNLTRAGVKIKASSYKNKINNQTDYCLTISGQTRFKKASFNSYHDHRTAMSLIIFSLACGLENKINDISCIDKSFPEFIAILETFYC
ncbi:MAG: 3-phosphoshikimate 1-carboxyvinyltransferase [Candidatus Omnitrophica bacterium]|nr:3-phosphoshikimate 1-carboxyvinyltransferase [Candidatus Omnitrophota bacterium]